MSKKGQYQIPFDKDGNQQHYAESWWVDLPNGKYERAGPEWRDNVPFQSTLTYVGFSRGRSAAYLDFKRANGKLVTVFMKDFEAMVPHMIKGSVSGTFQFTKRGQNYGCQLVEAAG
ncbi:hypothetical protein [Bradyrhizobium sp. SZCCHNR3118]|uniref:hypothetical protein n=1 Tax=Bradyrhizobium sp. SZCCHNR3118 TaxID=3057468 RepID=UPI002915F73C|nr:hypothetical protein [Bradyrhizobium sp. SZCCHNR3118]